MAGFAPAGDGFFDEAGLGVMLDEKLRLAVDQFGGLGFAETAQADMRLGVQALRQCRSEARFADPGFA